MGYLGNRPAEAYSAFQKQDFSTSATTSYTLDHPVANQNEIALFINFVRQEPTAAYTASGTTLTLTSATSSSDDMYCVYLGKAVQTVNPPSGSVGTAQLASTSVTAAKLNNDIISGTTALASEPADTDEFLVSDAGTLKRIDYSFIKPSSDFVLLSSTTPSSANTFSIDGHFTSDYDIYKIYALGMSGSSMSNTRLSYKMNVSGSAVTGYAYSTVNNSGSTLSVWADNTSATSMDLGYLHNSSGSTSQGNLEMIIHRPLSTDKTTIIHQMTAWDNGTTFGRYFGATGDKTARAISGITLGCGAFGSGNLEADRILVYGMKNS